MSFFHQKVTGSGTVVVQPPGGSRAILFDSLHAEGGWFFSSHGYTRVGEDAFANAVSEVLGAMMIRREDPAADIQSDRSRIFATEAATLYAMAGLLKTQGANYERLLAAEQASIEGLGTEAIEVRYPVDAENRPEYEAATARSIIRARADTAAALVDGLIEIAADLDPYPEQVVAYTLLQVTEASRSDLRVDVQMDLSDSFLQSLEHYRAAGWTSFDVWASGPDVARIDGGLFDVDALIALP